MKLFKRKSEKQRRRAPSWEEVIKLMHDKGLNYEDGIIDVLYAPDNAHRFVIYKDEDFLTYEFEKLYAYDEDELQFVDEVGYWASESEWVKPIFNDMKILMRELKATPEFKVYFDGVGNSQT